MSSSQTSLRSLEDRRAELYEYNKEAKEIMDKWVAGTLTENDRKRIDDLNDDIEQCHKQIKQIENKHNTNCIIL